MSNNKQDTVETIWETWDSVLLKTMTLGVDIQNSMHQGKTPTITKIACIPRGGMYVVNVLARQLALSGDKVLSLGMSRYDREDAKQAGEFKIGQMPVESDVEGETVLLAEEIFDSCETVERAVKELLALGAKSVVTAAIHYKPSKNKTNFVPDFYVTATSGWVYYPWEVIDPIGTLHQRSVSKG